MGLEGITYCEENKHCLVCHYETALVIYHPARNLKLKEYGSIEVICKNEKCKAELKIPILDKPKMKSKGKIEGWW